MGLEQIDFNKIQVFGGKSLGNLMQEIYNRSKEKEESIKAVVEKMASMLDKPNTALLLAPVISQYYDAGIRNDDQLLKLVSLLQKFLSTKTEEDLSGGFSLTPEERSRLEQEYGDLIKKDNNNKSLIETINVPQT